MERVERKRPYAVWKGLTKDERAEVVILAKQGRAHPDPAVRSTAQDWARTFLAPRRWGIKRTRTRVALGVLFLAPSWLERSDSLLSWLSLGLGWFVIIGAVIFAQQQKLAAAILKADELAQAGLATDSDESRG